MPSCGGVSRRPPRTWSSPTRSSPGNSVCAAGRRPPTAPATVNRCPTVTGCWPNWRSAGSSRPLRPGRAGGVRRCAYAARRIRSAERPARHPPAAVRSRPVPRLDDRSGWRGHARPRCPRIPGCGRIWPSQGTRRSSARARSSSKPDSGSFRVTAQVVCGTLTSSKPSRTPLPSNAAWICRPMG